MVAPPAVPPELWRVLELEARAKTEFNGPAHDFAHVERVVNCALRIAHVEGLAIEEVGAAAVASLLHELYTLPKNHPDSSRAGDECSVRARALLDRSDAPRPFSETVCSAIADHAFSKGVVPVGTVSRVVQDADRLDALGAIGLARMWATCADMRRPFYSPADPLCDTRAPDDKQWGIDHVYKKLLAIPDGLHTNAAREMARERVSFLHVYLAQFRSEIGA